jgi:hypothetical protein
VLKRISPISVGFQNEIYQLRREACDRWILFNKPWKMNRLALQREALPQISILRDVGVDGPQ